TGDPDHFDRVAEAHERMEEIVGDVLALARAGSDLGDTEAISLEAVASDAWANVETRGATLDVADDATVEADRTTLLQLFENLFRNSIEHGSTEEDALSVRVGVLREEGNSDDVVTGFFVEDDGPGIPEAERERVFDSGVSGAADGTGFGLAIVRSIAEAHGWTVEATAASGRTGARFAFEFGSPVDVGDDPVGGRSESASATSTSTTSPPSRVDDQSM
ncbi:sensor histidine kinase, partial [Halobium palmae]